LPIDLRVVVLEPGITEDHVLLSEAGDSEEHSFGVGFVAKDYVYNFGDLACLVGGTVHVVHCKGDWGTRLQENPQLYYSL